MNVYYTVTVNGTALTLVSVDYDEEMFETGSFKLVFRNDKGDSPQTNYNTCVGAAGTSAQGKDVLISRKGTQVFRGVVTNVQIDNKYIAVSGLGNAWKLAWDTCTEWQEYTATAANTVISNLLSGVTDITLGTSDYTSSINVGYQEGENKFRAIYGLVKNYLGGECYVDSDNKLQVKTAMGTDKSATVTLEHGVNIRSLKRDIDSFGLINWAKGRSAGEGTFSLTTGPDEDGASQSAYGKRKNVHDGRRIYNQSELDSVVDNILADYKDPVDTVEKVRFIDKGDYGLVIGDTVTITNSRLGVSGTYRIFGMKYLWNTRGETVTATISNTARTLDKEISNLAYRLDIEKFYPQGSPLWIPIQIPLTAVAEKKYPSENSGEITHVFEIPDESDWNVTINSGKVSIIGAANRIWQKAAAGGGSSTPTSGIQSGGHTHQLAEETFNIAGYVDDSPGAYTKRRFLVTSQTTTFWINLETSSAADIRGPHNGASEATSGFAGSHTHNVTLPNHTHNPEPGIYETADYPDDVELWVNGTKVADKASHAGLDGGAAIDVRNIDIKDELLTGKNTIILKSVVADSKGMLSMSGGARVFVRSRS